MHLHPEIRRGTKISSQPKGCIGCDAAPLPYNLRDSSYGNTQCDGQGICRKSQGRQKILAQKLTGVYGYVKVSNSINLWVVSGGYDAYVGLGGFWLPAISTGPLNAVAPGAGLGVPYVIGNVGYEVWGEILGGLVSADGWTDLQVIAPYPFSFQGTVGLHACAAWLVCGTADVSVGLNSVQGFYVN